MGAAAADAPSKKNEGGGSCRWWAKANDSRGGRGAHEPLEREQEKRGANRNSGRGKRSARSEARSKRARKNVDGDRAALADQALQVTAAAAEAAEAGQQMQRQRRQRRQTSTCEHNLWHTHTS
jgi:hypothetical protein